MSPFQKPIPPINSSFCFEIRYNLGNKDAKLLPLTYSSNQNLILSPTPIFHLVLSLNHFLLHHPPQTFFKSLHHKGSLEASSPSFLPKAHLGGEAPSSMAYSLVDGASSHLFFLCLFLIKTLTILVFVPLASMWLSLLSTMTG